MLRIDAWKRIVILGVCLFGLALALPNLFYARVEAHNDAATALERGAVATPEIETGLARWPEILPSGLVNLGLDLRGGAHLLAEVQLEDVHATRVDGYWPEVRDALRQVRDEVGTIRRQDGPPDELRVRISRPEGLEAAVEAVRALSQPIASLTGVGARDIAVSGAGDVVTVTLSDAERARLTQIAQGG